jgi:hypothetical protein
MRRRTDRGMLMIAGWAIAVQLGGSIAWGAEPDETYAGSSGLFELAVPGGWVAEEHADGGGVRIATSSGEAAVEITFIPRSVLHSGGLKMGAPAGAGPAAVAESMAILMPPAEGVEASEPVLLELANATEAVEIAASGPELEGALYILEPSPGVAAIVSATAPAGGFADVRDATLGILASLVFGGDEAALIELLQPPPFVDISLG